MNKRAETIDIVTQWIVHLPMVLWELKAQNLVLSEVINLDARLYPNTHDFI